MSMLAGRRWPSIDDQPTRSSCAAPASTTCKNISVELPRDKLDRVHRAVGLGQVEPRLRHDLRRGPAPLRRVAVVVRPAVPRPDGQARRRLHRGPVAGHLDRPEVGVAATPARRSARSPRSTTTCACSTPASACQHCPNDGTRLAAPDARSRSSTGSCELPEGTRFQVLAPVVRGRKGEYEHAARGPRRRRATSAPASTARSSTSPSSSSAPTGWPATSSTRSRSSSTGWCSARASSAGSPTRWRRRCGWPRAWPRSSSCRARATRRRRDADVQPAPGLPDVRHESTRSWRRATSRSTRRTAPARRATGSAPRSRSTPSWSCPTPTCRSTRAPSPRGAAAHTQYFTRMLEAVAEDARASTSTRRGRSSPSQAAEGASCTAPRARSR